MSGSYEVDNIVQPQVFSISKLQTIKSRILELLAMMLSFLCYPVHVLTITTYKVIIIENQYQS